MPIFEDMFKLVEYARTAVLDDISEIIKEYSIEVLREKIIQTVYRRSSKGDYIRTKSMLNSVNAFRARGISGGEGKAREYQTYPDKKKMNFTYPSFYKTNGKGGLDNRDNIVNWLNDGHKGWYKGRKVNYKGTHFIEKAQKKLETKLIEKIKKELSARGYEFDKKS